MSDNRANIAIIGDRDSVMLFKAIGLAVYAENEALGASKRIAALARAGCKVIFITEPLFAAVRRNDRKIQGSGVSRYHTGTGQPRIRRRRDGEDKG